MTRAIIHVDMDAFYAAIEQRDQPSLRGKPVIVAGLGRRGVVSTASYEARAFGVRSAMPTVTARRLCPQGEFVEPRHEVYADVSHQVFEVFARMTPQIEGLSLDEAFLDVTASLTLLGSAASIGHRIKREVREATGLNCSVGIAHNKLLAKLASEMGKPDGHFEITPEGVRACLDPLPVGRMWTIGKVAAEKLERIGIRTVGQMRVAPLSLLSRALGSHAASAQALARGEDERDVVPDREEKSISAEHTFEEDLATLADARAWILRLAERVGERTRARQLRGRTITVKLRVPPFETMTRQSSLGAPTSVTAEIAGAADRLLETWWRERRGARLRLLGVGLSGFGDDPAQVDLFAKPKVDRRDSLADEINRKFGRGAIRRARTLDADET